MEYVNVMDTKSIENWLKGKIIMDDVTIFLLSMLMGAVCTIIVLCMIFFIIMVTGVNYKSKRNGLCTLSRCCRKK